MKRLIYNLPILTFLVEKGYFVTVINPCVMKKYARNINFRNVKTDKRDSVTIANYGIEKWLKMKGRKFITYEEILITLKDKLCNRKVLCLEIVRNRDIL